MIGYYAAERKRSAEHVEGWARFILAHPEKRADFEQQAAVPRAPYVRVGVHAFARRVMSVVRRLEEGR